MNIRNSPFWNGEVIPYSLDLHRYRILPACKLTKGPHNFQQPFPSQKPSGQIIKQTIERGGKDTYKTTDPGSSETTRQTNKSYLYILATNRACSLPPHKRGVLHRPQRLHPSRNVPRAFLHSQEENSPIIAAWLTDGACDPFAGKSKTTLCKQMSLFVSGVWHTTEPTRTRQFKLQVVKCQGKYRYL